MTRADRAPGMFAAALVMAAAIAVPAVAMAQQAHWPSPVHDDRLFWFLLIEELEISWAGDTDPVAWDIQGWAGGDYNRIWMKSEGEAATRGGGGQFELQALYSRLIAPFWDLQAGIRYDRRFGPGADVSRAHLAVGLEGLAPYWFEVEPTVFISDDGDVSARVTASYDMLLTQRLILQPKLEIDLAAQTVEEWGVGSGLSDIAAELRLRYELRREFAPYVGVSWFERVGRTADLARDQGERVTEFAVRYGFRLWF